MKTFQTYLDTVNQAIAAIPYPEQPNRLAVRMMSL